MRGPPGAGTRTVQVTTGIPLLLGPPVGTHHLGELDVHEPPDHRWIAGGPSPGEPLREVILAAHASQFGTSSQADRHAAPAEGPAEPWAAPRPPGWSVGFDSSHGGSGRASVAIATWPVPL